MQNSACQPTVDSSTRKNWSRQQVAEALSNFESLSSVLDMSLHEFARRAGVPRTTLQWWLERQAAIDAPTATGQFFESPEGLELLHRIVVAAMVVITLLGAGGIRLVCTFL